LIHVYSQLATKSSAIMSGFERARIQRAVQEARVTETMTGDTDTTSTSSIIRPGIYDILGHTVN